MAPEPTIEVQQRIEIIQKLISAQGTERYGKLQQQAAKQLGITVRSLQQLVTRWRDQGLSALSKQPRVDHGAVRISSEWRDFILKTYREGDRGSRGMTPAQVSLRSCPCPEIRCRGLSEAHDCLPDAPTANRKTASKAIVRVVGRPLVDHDSRGD